MSRSKKIISILESLKVDDKARAAGILFQYKDEVLLVKRSKELDNPGKWTIPGGYTKQGECEKDAAIRECREEIGMMPGYLDTGKVMVSEKDGVKYTTFLMLPDKKMEEIMVNWESECFEWFNIKKLPEDIYPGFNKVVEELATVTTDIKSDLDGTGM